MNHAPERSRDALAPAGSGISGSGNRTHPLEADQREEWAAVGGCNGVYIVSRRQVNDYYKAHACAACGAAILLGLKALGALAF